MNTFIIVACIIVIQLVLFYVHWCFARRRLFEEVLNAHYDKFVQNAMIALDEDEEHIMDHPTVAHVLLNKKECIRTTQRLNAFFVHSVESTIERFVQSDETERDSRIAEAVQVLRDGKCESIRFFLRWCRVSGYISAACGIRIPRNISKLVEILSLKDESDSFEWNPPKNSGVRLSAK